MASTINITPDMFTKVNNDVNGNPRYVLHFLNLITDADTEKIKTDYADILARNPFELTSLQYAEALRKSRKAGGKKYHNKKYGGGIVFQSYSLPDTIKHLQ